MTAELLALELIDAFLSDTKNQSLIDADRVRDLLLDLRPSVEFLESALRGAR